MPTKKNRPKAAAWLMLAGLFGLIGEFGLADAVEKTLDTARPRSGPALSGSTTTLDREKHAGQSHGRLHGRADAGPVPPRSVESSKVLPAPAKPAPIPTTSTEPGLIF